MRLGFVLAVVAAGGAHARGDEMPPTR